MGIVNVSGSVYNSFSGISQLVSLFHNEIEKQDGILRIDFSATSFISANLCSAIGVYLDIATINGKTVDIHTGDNDKIRQILCRNEFLSHFGAEEVVDVNGTVIKFSVFTYSQDELFATYILDDLFRIRGMPIMSKLLKTEFARSFTELFANAFEHGPSVRVYCCGQHYPQKNKIDLTISNQGNTIGDNLRRRFNNSNITDIEAVRWAIIRGNSTKEIDMPKGLGLDIVLGFLKLNQGRIFIVSGYCYWEANTSYPEGIGSKLPFRYPGTIVNIEVDTSDNKRYILSNET